MKVIVNILRVLVGILFIFSGLVKSNDPTGFSYKLDEYFSVFAADLEPSQDSVDFRIAMGENVVDKKVVINSANPQIEVVVSTNRIEPSTTEGNETPKFVDVEVVINNSQLFSQQLEAADSNVTIGTLHLLHTIKDTEGEKMYEFVGYNNFNDVYTIDVSDYVVPNAWYVGFLQDLRKYALQLAIFLCALEIVLGLALLIGFAPKLTTWLLLLTIVFFTFLTWYSAQFNKVTDCGCFGDAIPLTPWESFTKDVVLLVSILIIFSGLKYIKPLFSTKFAVRLLTVATLLTVGFSAYCKHYLPVKNFLKFKKGNNIEALATVPEGAPVDVYENVFIYEKDGKKEEFTLDELGKRNLKEEGYVFVDRIDKLISKGYEPEIHDFKIMDETRSNDYVQDFFDEENYKLLIVINDVELANTKAIPALKEIITVAKENNVSIYPLTASGTEQVEAFEQENKLGLPYYYGDKTNLKSIIRSNPGLVLINAENEVVRNWPSTRLPKPKRFVKKLK
jgi:uncharacterized membrane protein YphA (DoxX/SURF4 family)